MAKTTHLTAEPEALPARRKKRKKNPDVIELASCFVHGGNPVDTRLLHLHHRIPLGYGGLDEPDNRRWLCGSCHDHVHRLSYLMIRGQSGVAHDLAMQAFPTTPSIRVRLLDLVTTAAEAMKKHAPSNNPEQEQDEVVVMQLHLPKSLHRRLKTLAATHTHPKSGRKVGLYRYCLTILQNHCKVAETESLPQATTQRLYRYEPQTETASTDPILQDL
jgi:hypothetical protein